jgi:hypothetical protein
MPTLGKVIGKALRTFLGDNVLEITLDVKLGKVLACITTSKMKR